uniref:Ras-GEF domain-containing protein n=1 Tax=Rhabditophanes sp. KR3021 TaxID=114890 RepID=A0AC35UF38_9BILA
LNQRETIRLSMTYVAQTWTLNITVMDSLAQTERSLVRRIFGIRKWVEEKQESMHNEKQNYKCDPLEHVSDLTADPLRSSPTKKS